MSDSDMADTTAGTGTGVLQAKCFNVNASHSDVANNTFIGLRIINNTHDLSYAEYTDVRDWDFTQVYFHELYDLKADPFQLRNLWPSASEAQQVALHERLRAEFLCEGESCTF